jgi:hypothetical protein
MEYRINWSVINWLKFKTTFAFNDKLKLFFRKKLSKISWFQSKIQDLIYKPEVSDK